MLINYHHGADIIMLEELPWQKLNAETVRELFLEQGKYNGRMDHITIVGRTKRANGNMYMPKP